MSDRSSKDARIKFETLGNATLQLYEADRPVLAVRRLISRYRRSFLLSLCSIDADMLNLVDEDGRRLVGPPEQRKAGAIQAVGDLCAQLGVSDFCCSSSQHLYVRPDSIWANPYRISYADMKAHWNSPARLIEPFVTADVGDGTVTPNHPGHASDVSRIARSTGDDDWQEKMDEEDWEKLERFVLQFRTLKKHVDFVRFAVAGESRTFLVSSRRGGRRGVTFTVPRHSLMETVTYGYFDDLLIGNFMMTHLSHMRLYPYFSPLVAKFGGSAKVYTPSQLWACRLHYFRLSPVAYLRYHLQQYWLSRWKSRVRALARRLGVFGLLKATARRMKGLPPVARPRGT